MCVSDEKLINYGQAIKPTTEFDTEVSDIDVLSIYDLSDGEYEITYTDKEKGEVVLTRDNEYKSCYKHARTKYGNAPLIRSDGKYIIDCKRITTYAQQEINLRSVDEDVFIHFGDSNCLTEIEPDHYKLTARYDPKNRWQRREGVMSYFLSVGKLSERGWTFLGDTSTDVEFTFTDEGVIINGTNGVSARISYASENADTEALLENEKKMAEAGRSMIEAFEMTEGFALCELTAVGETLISYKDSKFTLKTDLDGDGEFEHVVEKGDVNCDGRIDARDASAVLKGYSAESTGEHSYVFRDCGDYNGDGRVDARDASEILAFYSKNSTI